MAKCRESTTTAYPGRVGVGTQHDILAIEGEVDAIQCLGRVLVVVNEDVLG